MKIGSNDQFFGEAALVASTTKAVVAPPWSAIFEQDGERKQTPVEAEATYHAMIDAYSSFGYALVALPLASVAERVGFIREQIRCLP